MTMTILPPTQEGTPTMAHPFNEEKYKKGIAALKNNKAAGRDDVLVEQLKHERIRWRKQKNGLPQGSVLSPILFNIYTSDQPLHNGTRSFIYADDLCVTAQQRFFRRSRYNY